MIFDMVVPTFGALMLGVGFGAIFILPEFERLATALRPPLQRATASALAPSKEEAGIVGVGQSTLSNGVRLRIMTSGQVQSFGNSNFGGNTTNGTATAQRSA